MTGRQIEPRFVNDWLMLNYPNELWITRQHIGPIPKKTVAAAYGVLMNWVDAIVIMPNKILLIEAKLRNEVKGIGQLLLYESLFAQTPKFSRYHTRPIEKILLCLRNIPAVKEEAEKQGIKYITYKPAWLLQELGFKS